MVLALPIDPTALMRKFSSGQKFCLALPKLVLSINKRTPGKRARSSLPAGNSGPRQVELIKKN